MIYVATVHWVLDRWIDVQLRYLEWHVNEPLAVYACLNGPDARQHSSRYAFAYTRPGWDDHGEKLNYLAEQICEVAADDDMLVFLDGDAFPIAELAAPVRSMLSRSPLVAVRRDENRDEFPHPSFCATTPRFWKDLGGDWRKPDSGDGDLGSRLNQQLAQRGVEWTPLLRTNARDLHPVLFGVYGGLIYHHGAGFRSGRPLTRADLYAAREEATSEPERDRLVLERADENARLEKLVYEHLCRDRDFHEKLFGSGDAAQDAHIATT